MMVGSSSSSSAEDADDDESRAGGVGGPSSEDSSGFAGYARLPKRQIPSDSAEGATHMQQPVRPGGPLRSTSLASAANTTLVLYATYSELKQT